MSNSFQPLIDTRQTGIDRPTWRVFIQSVIEIASALCNLTDRLDKKSNNTALLLRDWIKTREVGLSILACEVSMEQLLLLRADKLVISTFAKHTLN